MCKPPDHGQLLPDRQPDKTAVEQVDVEVQAVERVGVGVVAEERTPTTSTTCKYQGCGQFPNAQLAVVVVVVVVAVVVEEVVEVEVKVEVEVEVDRVNSRVSSRPDPHQPSSTHTSHGAALMVKVKEKGEEGGKWGKWGVASSKPSPHQLPTRNGRGSVLVVLRVVGLVGVSQIHQSPPSQMLVEPASTNCNGRGPLTTGSTRAEHHRHLHLPQPQHRPLCKCMVPWCTTVPPSVPTMALCKVVQLQLWCEEGRAVVAAAATSWRQPLEVARSQPSIQCLPWMVPVPVQVLTT
jgi:hypothetical protein